MASLQSYPGKGKDAGKTFYRLQPYVLDEQGERKRITLRLGHGLKRAEKSFKAIEDLIDCRFANVEPSAATKKWLEELADKSLAEALLANRLIDQLPDQHSENKRDVTVEGLAEQFICEFEAGKAATTVTTYRQAKETLLGFFAGRSVDSVTASDAREFWSWMITERGLAENTAKVRLRNIRSMFELAIESELIAKNPFKAKGLSTSQTAANKQYVPKEVVAEVIKHCPSLEWKVFFRLVRTIPMRIPSELQDLTWGDVDAENNRILIHSPKTRHIGKHARLVPIFKHLRKPLNDLFHNVGDDETYVFPTIRKLSNVAKIAADHVEKAKVKQWPIFFNSLRASAETDLMDEYGLRLACQWAGNSAATAMKNYALVRNTDFDDSGRSKVDAKSDAIDPFDAKSDAEPASLGEQTTRENTGKVESSRSCENRRDDLIGQAGLEPATKGL